MKKCERCQYEDTQMCDNCIEKDDTWDRLEQIVYTEERFMNGHCFCEASER
jgi:hypothetical protein